MKDNINPQHYRSHPSGIEAIEITRHMNFNTGNAMKYLWRAGLKTEDPTEDLQKAIWYITDEIGRIAAAKPKVVEEPPVELQESFDFTPTEEVVEPTIPVLIPEVVDLEKLNQERFKDKLKNFLGSMMNVRGSQ